MEETYDECIDECSLETIEDRQDPSLCCCYAIDSEGKYEDPCYHPREQQCCCCDPLYE